MARKSSAEKERTEVPLPRLLNEAASASAVRLLGPKKFPID